MYGFPLLLEICVTTVEIILSSYVLLATLLGFQNVETNAIGQFISLMTAWLIHYAFKLISITAPCQSATTEAENTAVLVQKLLLARHFDQDSVTELQLFSQQLLQRKMKFTAFGFLSIDYSLLFTIIGGVTTFLVVAMHFRI
jgi:gustatory receptor